MIPGHPRADSWDTGISTNAASARGRSPRQSRGIRRRITHRNRQLQARQRAVKALISDDVRVILRAGTWQRSWSSIHAICGTGGGAARHARRGSQCERLRARGSDRRRDVKRSRTGCGRRTGCSLQSRIHDSAVTCSDRNLRRGSCNRDRIRGCPIPRGYGTRGQHGTTTDRYSNEDAE
jgi:hypothetical protein